jgi:hypothetical protein
MYTNLSCEIVEKVNGCEIQRCEAIKEDPITGERSGHVKVFYDVVADDVLLESFKTLAKARAFAKAYW